MPVAMRLREASITVPPGTVTPPTPTLSGFLSNGTASASWTLTPTRTCTGEVALLVQFAIGTSISGPPTITGGGSGVTWTRIPPTLNESMPPSSRQFFFFWGHGTFDGSNITITPADNPTGECGAHLIDWADTKTTKPFMKLTRTVLAGANHTSHVQYQQLRAGSNNALGGYTFHGSAGTTEGISIDNGTVLKSLTQGTGILTTLSYWKATDFTNHKVTANWPTSSSSGGYMYEVQATDGDDGPHANIRSMWDWSDNAGNITVTQTITPKANEVVCFIIISERAASSADLASVSDGSNSYSKVAAFNIDADHRCHVWAFRYGATPPTNVTITATNTLPLIGSVGTILGLRKEDGTGLAGSTNTDWLVQSVTNSASSATSISATVSSIAQHSSILAVFGKCFPTGTVPAADMVFKEGWVVPFAGRDIVNTGEVNESQGILVSWLGGDEDSTPSATTTEAGNLGVLALEVV